jgi:polygalacturonase
VEISGLTFKRAGFWTVQIAFSERVTVDGITIRANVELPPGENVGEVTEGGVTIRGNIRGYGPSSDGINIDSSRNVLVQNSDIDCNDDNICLKAGRDADGLRVNRPTENVIIRNCITRAGHGMLTIGSETSGGIRNIHAYNLKAIGTANGVRFKSARVRGGLIENIRVHDVEMTGVGNPVHWELNWYPSYSYPVIPDGIDTNTLAAHWRVLTERVEPAERGIPEFRNISISNLTARGASQAFYVNAYPEKPIRNVRLENVAIEAAKAGTFANAADWTLNNVVITTSDGDNVRLRNSTGVPLPKTASASP